MIRLAAIDLDGTLLRNDGSISARTRRALASVEARGLTIVLVSARHPSGLSEVATAAHVGGFAICSNGANVLDLDTGTIVRSRALESVVTTALVRAIRERVPGVLFAVEAESELAFEPEFSAWNWTPPPGTRYGDAVELVAEPVTRLIIRHADYALEALAELVREVVGDKATVVVPGPWTVELSGAGVNKATALAELCGELGIDATEVIAFGDYPNDLPMLAWAGRSIAVANAHPDVLAAAMEVTSSNDNDGVAAVLERLSLP